jgi:uncharacterized protein (TIGR00369 family)
MTNTPRFAGFGAKIRDSFARQDMMHTLGAELIRVEAGDIVIAAPVLPGMRQQHGFAHAAVTFAIGDSSAGYAALSLMDEAAEVLTVEMKINLLAPATGRRLLAKGHVVRAGRRLMVVGATVLAEDDDGAQTQVALLQGTMIPV